MSERMAGTTALVTGATSNIGRAIAVAFAAEGAHVAVGGRDPGRGAEVVSEIERAGGRATFLAAELDGSMAASRGLAADAERALGGRVDVLVNNAGIFPGSTTATVDEAMFDAVFAVNVKAPFFLTAQLAPGMAERGRGSIINLGSWVARLGIPIGALYASTKGAMETLTRAWAAEFGSPGVRVNAISPGVVRAQPIPDDPAGPMMRGTPYGEPGTAESIASAAVFLASEESRFVNGAVLDVDGGRTGVAVIAG
jgi:NAD(P)-dependent dehydrogenase (short-subunit alcohol dehydrogenase family)